MPIVYKKLYLEETEEELMSMSREEVTASLTDRERAFCEHYTRNFNITLATKRAGYKHRSAHNVGWKIRQKPEVNRYIAWLKLKTAKQCHVEAVDIVDQYIRIGFADITDFATIKNGKVQLVDSDMIDGQLVTEVKQGRDGITIKLADKLAALDKLERYFDVMPKDWREKIEERKLEILKQKVELEKLRLGVGEEEAGDDGFIDALRESAEEVWNGEE